MKPVIQPSASSLPRLFLCLASGLLKQVDYQTTYAEEGQGRHAEQEDAIVAGDLSKLPEKVLPLIEGMTVRAEVSVVYDVATHTARELGTQLGRSYGTLKPFEIPGTIDMLAVGNGRVVIGDWKGWEEVDHPERNRQTMLYALAAALIYGVTEVTVVIYYLSRPDSDPIIATLDLLELDAYAQDLQDLYVRSARAANDPHAAEVVGPQCKYCKAFHDCDSQKRLASDLQGDVVVSTFNSLIPFENDQEAAAAFDLKERVRLWLKRVEAALAARAKERPIPLNDGRMYGEIEKMSPKQIDGDKAYEYLRDTYGQDLADHAVSREASQAGIERALRRADIKNPVKTKDAIVKELEARGAVTQKRKVELGTYTATKQLKAANE